MKKILLVMASVVFLMAGVANADYTANLHVGNDIPPAYTMDNTGSYLTTNGASETVQGGSIMGSILNSVPLPWVYCIDLYVTIPVPADYDQTIVNNNGAIHGSPTTNVNNAGEIAWLLSTYAVASEGNSVMQHDMQIALQAAIWHVEFGATLDTGTVDGTAAGLYAAYIAAAIGQSAPLADFDWLSPLN